MTTAARPTRPLRPALNLDYPMSLGIFDDYSRAQHVVALFGLVWSQIGLRAATRGGTRDFASVSQVIATKYEVLVEHRFIEQARQLVAAMPQM